MLTETPILDHLSNDRARTPRARNLARIVDMLSETPSVRTELVEDIRRQVAAGTYATEAKLDMAIGRMLKDILA